MQNDDNNTTTMISRNFAKIAAVLLLLFMATVARAQILDGTVQSARYRVSMPLTLNFDDGSINSSPYVSYKQDILPFMALRLMHSTTSSKRLSSPKYGWNFLFQRYSISFRVQSITHAPKNILMDLPQP